MLHQNVMIFLPKNFTIFLSGVGETDNVQNSNLTNFRRPSFGDDIDVILIS